MKEKIAMKKFRPGKLLVTRAINTMQKEDPDFSVFLQESLKSYSICDWGCMCSEDQQLNDASVQAGRGIVHGAYIYPKTCEKIWIITEYDWSVTTILFPHEY